MVIGTMVECQRESVDLTQIFTAMGCVKFAETEVERLKKYHLHTITRLDLSAAANNCMKYIICSGKHQNTVVVHSVFKDDPVSGSHERHRLPQGHKVTVQLLPQGGLLWPFYEPQDVLEWAVQDG